MKLALAAFLLACAAPIGTATEPILGGALDTTDTSVVALFIESANGPANDSECSATVVSPHVLLTAAHCLSPDVVGPIQSVQIFIGTDSDDPTELSDPSNYVDVASFTPDPAFTAEGTTHDIGVVVAAAPLAQTPIAISHDGLGSGDIGTPVHVVGYGETNGADETTSGQRRSLDSKIFSVDDGHLGLDDVICFGDSGGPSFVTKNGTPVVAGVHSFGPPSNCIGIGEDTRVDQYTSFVDDAIDQADPGFLPGGCNTSGGSGDPIFAVLALGAMLAWRACPTRPRS
ncbi:MAG TPA: trypsin-like serine protease [Polyangiaceae bacterium]|jgi:V8-like Glu-specific endopeptidase